MNTLTVRLFGGLRAVQGDRVLLESKGRLGRPAEAFAYLLLHRQEAVTNEQLIEALWEDENLENPAGALKNAIYNLRKQLRDAGLEGDCIRSSKNRYQLTPGFPVELDTEDAEECYRTITRPGVSDDDLLRAGRALFSLYSGDLLQNLPTQRWIVQYNVYYRRLYLDAVDRVCTQLLKDPSREHCEEVLAICRKANLIEPLQEPIYLYMFTAMQQLGMKKAILNYYPITANLFYDELGERLCAEIRQIYFWASEGTNLIEQDLQQIQEDLAEITKDQRPIRGAYFCPYEMFKHIYHMVARSAERAGNNVVLLLLTLTKPSGGVLPKDLNVTAMLKLKSAISRALRKGDVFSRYSKSQYILMLSVRQFSDVEIITERLQKCFAAEQPPKGVRLQPKARELSPIV